MFSLACALLCLLPAEVTFAKRRFHDPGPELRLRLEGVGEAFRVGYHAALDQDEAAPLGERLDEIPASLQGFAYERAGMALALKDALSLRRRDRIEQFLAGRGDLHLYLVTGRSTWLVCGVDVDRIATTIRGFAATRQADLWADVGLACAYAGGRNAEEMRRLRAGAGEHELALAQGAVFAATVRERAGNPGVRLPDALRPLVRRRPRRSGAPRGGAGD